MCKYTCLGCDEEGEEPHLCPYKVEMNDCYEFCTCCESCTEQCFLDIEERKSWIKEI